MHLFKLHLKQFFLVTLTAVTLVLIYFAGKQIGYDNVITFIQNEKILGIPIYIGYTILSVIIIPLPAVPLWPIALYLYGFWPTVILTLLGTILGAVINFSLARTFGKSLVIKMLGRKIYKEIEHLISIDNTKTFILVRFFGNNYFDAISYVAGISKLSLKKYFVITTIGSTAWLICILALMQKLGGIENIKSLLSVMGLYGTLVLVGTLSWEILHKYHKIGKLRKRIRV